VTASEPSLDARGIGGAYEDSVGDVLSGLDFVFARLSSRLDGGMCD
jgi:hypothetical protein